MVGNLFTCLLIELSRIHATAHPLNGGLFNGSYGEPIDQAITGAGAALRILNETFENAESY